MNPHSLRVGPASSLGLICKFYLWEYLRRVTKIIPKATHLFFWNLRLVQKNYWTLSHLLQGNAYSIFFWRLGESMIELSTMYWNKLYRCNTSTLTQLGTKTFYVCLFDHLQQTYVYTFYIYFDVSVYIYKQKQYIHIYIYIRYTYMYTLTHTIHTLKYKL